MPAARRTGRLSEGSSSVLGGVQLKAGALVRGGWEPTFLAGCATAACPPRLLQIRPPPRAPNHDHHGDPGALDDRRNAGALPARVGEWTAGGLMGGTDPPPCAPAPRCRWTSCSCSSCSTCRSCCWWCWCSSSSRCEWGPHWRLWHRVRRSAEDSAASDGCRAWARRGRARRRWPRERHCPRRPRRPPAEGARPLGPPPHPPQLRQGHCRRVWQEGVPGPRAVAAAAAGGQEGGRGSWLRGVSAGDTRAATAFSTVSFRRRGSPGLAARVAACGQRGQLSVRPGRRPLIAGSAGSRGRPSNESQPRHLPAPTRPAAPRAGADAQHAALPLCAAALGPEAGAAHRPAREPEAERRQRARRDAVSALCAVHARRRRRAACRPFGWDNTTKEGCMRGDQQHALHTAPAPFPGA